MIYFECGNNLVFVNFIKNATHVFSNMGTDHASMHDYKGGKEFHFNNQNVVYSMYNMARNSFMAQTNF